jgi:hypothetical protein
MSNIIFFQQIPLIKIKAVQDADPTSSNLRVGNMGTGCQWYGKS